MNEKKETNYKLIDFLKLFFAFCVIGIHTGFLLDYKVGYYLLTIVFRLAVPFFFVTSGYFLSKKVKDTPDRKKEVIIDFIKRTSWIYFVVGLIYLILNLLKGNNFSADLILLNIWQLITGNSWSVMWFCGASIISAIILLFIKNIKVLRYSILISFIIYLLGLLFNTYNHLLIGTDLQFFYNFLFQKFSNNSNFLFVGFMYFGLGYYICQEKQKIFKLKNIIWYGLLLAGTALLILEVTIVKKNLDVVSYYEYYLAHIMIIPSIVILALKSKINNMISLNTNNWRKLSTYIFYFHPFVLELIILYSKYNPNVFIRKNIPFYFITCLITLLISTGFRKIMDLKLNTEEKRNKIICAGLYVFSAIALIFVLLTLFNTVIWVDETCSLAMVKHSFKDIINLNSNDVHPPLYYILLKIFINGIELIKSGLNPIILGKVFSIIPLFILIFVSLKKIKEKFGNLAAALFVTFLIGMPNMMQFFVEIRMYSWALLFATLAFIKMYDILNGSGEKNWILFSLFGILAAYTHLYSCLIIVLMFMFLLGYFIIKKDNKNIINWLIFGGITLLLYMPWILQIIRQLKIVGTNFWIPPISFNDIKEYAKFIFYSQTNDRISRNFFGTLVVLLLLKILLSNRREKNDAKKNIIFLGVIILGTVIGIGIVVSLILSPLFIARYMYPALGLFWLSYSIGLSYYIQKNKLNIFVIFIPILMMVANLNNFMLNEVNLNKNQPHFYDIQKILSKDSIVITNHGHIQLLTAYFLPNKKIYLYDSYNSPMIEELFGNIEDGIDIDIIKAWSKEKKKIYFIELDKYKPIEMIFIKNKIKYVTEQKYNEDWYQMNLYSVN